MGQEKEKRANRPALREEILDVFNANPKRSLNYKQVSAAMGLTKKSSRQLVEMLLLEMTEEGLLSEVIPGKYKLLSLAAQITGTVDMTAAGSAYIVPRSEERRVGKG